MRARLTATLMAVATLALPLRSLGLDSVHKQDDANQACYYCHTLSETSPGGGQLFTSACLSCHYQRFEVPWIQSDEAVPGVTGMSHNWSAPATNAEFGSNPALGFPHTKHLVDGNLQCTACHDAHSSSGGVDPKSMHTTIPIGSPRPKTGTYGAGTGTASMTLTAEVGASAQGFRLRIQTVAGGGGTFIISHDMGATANGWLNWNGSAWVVGSEAGTGRAFTNDADVALDASGVSVQWTAGAAAGDYWDFHIAYPFLRVSNVSDSICTSCHKERVMNHVRARGDDRYYRPNGVRKFSHPVSVGLNVNGFGSDRAVILDADGTAGSSTTDGQGDVANASNDLELKGGVVRCTTCHAVHNADSNSLSVDSR